MYNVHIHAGAKRKLLYGCAFVREIINSLKLADYLPVHMHKSINNQHIAFHNYRESVFLLLCILITFCSIAAGHAQHIFNLCNLAQVSYVLDFLWLSRWQRVSTCIFRSFYIIVQILLLANGLYKKYTKNSAPLNKMPT